MRLTTTILTAAVVACSSLLVAAQQGDAHAGHDHSKHTHDKAEIAHEAPAFSLKGVDGKTYTLADYKGKVVVLEWFCSSCPASGRGEGSFWGSGKAAATIEGMRKADADAVYFAVNSTKDGFNSMSNAEEGSASAEVMSKAGASVPVLLDADGKVGKAYGAKTTPHVFIIAADGNVAYIGAPVSKDGKTNYVVNAVTALKAGKPVEPATTKNEGCGVKYAKQ